MRVVRLVDESEPRTSGGPSTTNDGELERLVQRAADGDVDAWADLYKGRFDVIYRYVRLLTGDSDVAEDLTQETFAKALTCLDRFSGRSTFSTWLHGIALNVVRRHWRVDSSSRRMKRSVADAALSAPPRGQCPDTATLRRIRLQTLYAVLASAPQPLREAFLLRDVAGHSQREAACILDVTENTVAIRASRARRYLRRELIRLGWLEEEG
ncbi:MAG: RNA polymerase sigma factor [Nannocystaceae bacterium]|nr:RNA polymerase sigma factor [Nannocystaceae bacterium]